MDILLAEEDALARSMLAGLIAERGHEVTEFRRGPETWEAYRQRPFPIVVVSAQLEGLSGIELCRRIRQHPRGRETFVLVVTAGSDASSLRDVLDAGANDCLSRPVDPDVLRMRLMIAEARAKAFAEVHAMDEALRESEALRLREAQESYAAKLTSLQTLAGGVAHDLNNQLTVILSSVQELMNLVGSEHAGHADLKWISYSANVIHQLADRLLAFSGGGNFEVRNLNLCDEIRRTVDMISARYEEDPDVRATFRVTLPEQPVRCRIDQGRFQAAVLQLLTNAVEALDGEAGEIEVAVETREVDPEELTGWASAPVLPGEPYASLRIRDEGPGMDADTLERVFDPFFSTKFTGRGMGLPSALGVIKGHQGHLLVTSREGEGTTAEALLPLCGAEAEAGRAEERTGPRETEGAAPAPGKEDRQGHVLIIDDESMVRQMAERTLGKVGYRTTEVSDGATAIEVFSADPKGVDLVLLDLSMPKMDGVEVLGRLREIDPGVKVLLISGYHATTVADRFTAQRPNGFLQKPFTIQGLREAVRDLVAGGAISGG